MVKLDEEERVYEAAHRAARLFAQACERLRDDSVHPDVRPLDLMLISLFEDLVELGFSKGEIRLAACAALETLAQN